MSSGEGRPPGPGEGEREEAAAPVTREITSMTASWLITDPDERIKKQEEEIRHLRGKIKGYETLGALYQEKRREVAQLKSLIAGANGETQSINQPMSSASLKSETRSKAEEKLQISDSQERKTDNKDNKDETPAPERRADEEVRTDSLISLTDPVPGETEELLHRSGSSPGDTGSAPGDTSSAPGDTSPSPGDTEELLSQSPPSRPQTSASSLSYKIINSDGSTVSGGSLENRRSATNLMDFTETKTQTQRQNSIGERIPSLRDESRIDSNAELSLNTREELSRLILGGDIDGDIIKYMLKSAKLEKQCRAKQALLDNIIVENQKIRADLAKSEAETVGLRQQLLSVTEERRKKDMSPEVKREELPSDWVRVERDRQQGAPGVRTVETSPKEAELRRKVDRLKQHAQELLKANTSWDNYCKRLKDEFEQRSESLRVKLHQSHHDNEQLKQEGNKRQGEVDAMASALNNRAEKAEKERDSAVREWEQEKLLSQEREQQYDIQKQRADLLEQQLNEQREIVQALTEDRRSMMSMRQGSPTGADSTEVQVLKQQVTIYKDDFDNERRDRERAQAEKATLSTNLEEVRGELRVAKDQIRQKQLEIGRINDDKRDCQRRYREVKQELTRLQNAMAAQNTNPPFNPGHVTTGRISYPPQQPPPPYDTSSVTQERKWSCKTCTFENPGLRITCEMCGAQKHRGSEIPTPVELLQQTQGFCQHRLTPHGNVYGQGFDQCDSSQGATGQTRDQTRDQRKNTVYPRLNVNEGTDDIDFDATDEKS